MPEVMETYLWQSSSFEKRFEGSFNQILGVDGRAPLRGEDQAGVLVKPYKPYLLLELALAVSPKGAYRPRRKVDLPAAPPGLGIAYSVPATLSHEGAPYAQRPALQVYVIPSES